MPMTAAVDEYVRHVSFDDLAPTMIDDHAQALKSSNTHIGFTNQFLHVPPQYNPLYRIDGPDFDDWAIAGRERGLGTSRRSSDQNQSHRDTVEKMFAFALVPPASVKKSSSDVPYRSRSGSPLRPSLSARLPPPPKISSLKLIKKSVDEPGTITDYNVADLDLETEQKMNKETIKNTQSNSGSSSGFTQSAFANLNELEDRLDSKNRKVVNGNPSKAPNNGKDDQSKKKKSFAGMSDAELASLEDFYASQSRSSASTPTIDKFDFREQDPVFIDKVVKKNSSTNIDPLAALYPSRPVVNHRAISMTIQHSKYEEYVEKINIGTGSKKPEESLVALRIVNCYISGKRYTWSSTDWYVENIAQDGDHFVIVTSIPWFEKELEDSDSALSWKRRNATQRLTRMMSADSVSVVDSDKDLSHSATSVNDNDTTNSSEPLSRGVRVQAIHEEAKRKCRKILEYYASRLKDKRVKITVEMIKTEKPIDAITKAATLYKPDIQIVSTVSTNLQIKFRNGCVKLPFFVMRHYAMPTLVVPFEFIDPKVLGEDIQKNRRASTEDTSLEPKGVVQPSGDARIALLNSIILKTLKNPFVSDSKEVNDEEASDHDDDSIVGSVNEYFPISPEKKRNIDLFERLGYIRAPPTRLSLLPKMKSTFDSDGNRLQPVSTASSSKRSSRIQYDDAIYKVKSLIDDSSEDESPYEQKSLSSRHYHGSSHIRKTKSMMPMSKTTSHSSMSPPQSDLSNSKRLNLNKYKSQGDASVSSSGTPKGSTKKSKPKKKGFASFIKKVFN